MASSWMDNPTDKDGLLLKRQRQINVRATLLLSRAVMGVNVSVYQGWEVG